MTVLGALCFEPGPVVAHEIAKPPDIGIPRVLHKSGKAGGQQLFEGPLARLIEGAGQ